MIDAHLHVVDVASSGVDRTGHPDGAWWETTDAAPVSVAARLASAGVAGGILVQAVGAHGFDNTFVLASAAALGDRWRAVAAVGPADPDPIATIEAAAGAGATGIRLFSVPRPEVSWLDRGLGRAVAARCAELALTPTICCLAEELGAAARLVGAFPGLEFALDHAGFAVVGGDEGDLLPLTRLENLVVKVSTGVFDHAVVDPAATVSRLIDLVGAERLAWGSDHPQVRDRPYGALVDLARDAVSGLVDASRTAILSATATRLWLR